MKAHELLVKAQSLYCGRSCIVSFDGPGQKAFGAVKDGAVRVQLKAELRLRSGLFAGGVET